MFVIGTAGHVDHGKSVLIQALTGIDPDRLPEEKEREMTIDLGFAWLKLPSGREVSIVDVPGHERFVKNMVAGVGGIDLALLIVAANEGVMAQTKEHLAILDLVGIKRGIIVITKRDLVDKEWLELVTLEVEEGIKGTTLAQAPILAVSAITGEGLPDLVSTIDHILDSTPVRKDIGRPRLPIDRVFTMAGFGTVVTGTLIDGCLSLGQELEILPSGLKARIRGLEMHKRKIDAASPGSRVAVNLAGVAKDDLKRGDILTNPGWLMPSKALDVKLCLLHDSPRPLSHNTWVTFHTGSSEVMGKVRLLEKEKLQPGETGWAQLLLTQTIAAVKGDPFIIRSPKETLGGGEIVDPYARRHRRSHPEFIESLKVKEKAAPQEVLLTTLEEKQPLELLKLAAHCHLSLDETEKIVHTLALGRKVIILEDKGPHSLLLSTQGLKHSITQLVQNYHQQSPLSQGISKEKLRERLKIPAQPFTEVLGQLLQDGVLVEDDGTVRFPSHQVRLTKEQQAAINAFINSLAQRPYSPPSELIPKPELLNLLIEQRRVVRISDGVILTTATYNEMVTRITDYIKYKGKITLAEARDLLKTSRKYAVALLEYLDKQKITHRIGDERVLLK